jgi:hypothetical protein
VSELDIALSFELEKIGELQDKIFPGNAPKDEPPSYLVYINYDYKRDKTLEGYGQGIEVHYLLNILSDSYSEMRNMTSLVEKTILTFPLNHIGENREIYIQDVTFIKIGSTFENELGLHRGIIDFKVAYKEA